MGVVNADLSFEDMAERGAEVAAPVIVTTDDVKDEE